MSHSFFGLSVTLGKYQLRSYLVKFPDGANYGIKVNPSKWRNLICLFLGGYYLNDYFWFETEAQAIHFAFMAHLNNPDIIWLPF